MPVRLLIPNALTVARLVLAGVFPFLPFDWWLPVALIALATEFLDGVLARALNAVSRFGQILDPIADKVFILVVVGMLLATGRLTPLELLLVAARDVAVLVGSLGVVLRGRSDLVGEMVPRLLGKVTTTLQFAFLLVILYQGQAPTWLLVPTAIVSIAAGVDYVWSFHRTHFRPELESRGHRPETR